MATILLYNGPIYTLDPAAPRVQALGIRDGRVIAAGSEGKVQAAVGGRAAPINLRGRAVIPALTDAHVHFVGYALSRGRWPRAAELDALVPDRPVFLMRKDGHSAWANSRALALAGIADDTPDPPGGSIQREKKRATGVLFETALDLLRRHIPDTTQEQRLAATRAAIVEAYSYGMASVHIPPGLSSGDAARNLADLQLLHERGQIGLRCLVHLGLDGLDDALRLGGVKMFADGSLGSETAEMLSHYEGRRHLGAATISTEELNEAVRRALAGGIAVTIHAIGDAANRRVLDAIELALQGSGARGQGPGSEQTPSLIPDPRPLIPNRIEHAQIIDPRDIPRFAQLG